MVTIDNYVENVKAPFNGDIESSRKDYERAVQGLEKIDQRLSLLEQAIKSSTGYDNVDLPKDPMVVTLETKDVVFNIDCDKRTKRPSYKSAVESMEKYLEGIGLLISQGHSIKGIINKGKTAYIEAGALLEAYEILVAGVMKPELKLTVKYEKSESLQREGICDRLKLGKEEDLTDETAKEYVRLVELKEKLKSFKESYEKAAPEGTTQVTGTKAISKKSSESEGVNWAYVVKTLVTVSTKKGEGDEGELNGLADSLLSFADRQKMFPDYKAIFEDDVLYVSLKSVYDRIQDLKNEKRIKSKKAKVDRKEIV